MLQHTKRQVKPSEVHRLTMPITALCVIYLFLVMKLRWPKNKSLYVTEIDVNAKRAHGLKQLSNVLQIKVTHIYEKSKMALTLSKIFTFYVVYNTS